MSIQQTNKYLKLQDIKVPNQILWELANGKKLNRLKTHAKLGYLSCETKKLYCQILENDNEKNIKM
jgi:hypothetical protein